MNDDLLAFLIAKNNLFIEYVRTLDVVDYSVILLILFVLSIVLRILSIIGILIVNLYLGHTVHPFTAINPDGKKILIVGDSTAAGVGAVDPNETIGGRLHHDFPRAEIINAAKAGSSLKNTLEQLQTWSHESFKLLIISTGGNDIFHGQLEGLEETLRLVLDKSIALSNHNAFVLLYSNIGSAPLFPSFIRWIIRRRTKKLQEVFIRVCAEKDVPCIDLYTSENISHNPFIYDSKHYFAIDGIHPNGEGYRLWYKRMWAEMVRSGKLFYD